MTDQPERGKLLDFLNGLLNDRIKSAKHFSPRVGYHETSHAFHTGGSEHDFDNIEALLAEIYGEPEDREVNELDGGKLLIGKRTQFRDGVSMVYLSEKNALGITVPDNKLHTLRERIRGMLAEEQGREVG